MLLTGLTTSRFLDLVPILFTAFPQNKFAARFIPNKLESGCRLASKCRESDCEGLVREGRLRYKGTIERKSGLEPSSALNQVNNEHNDGNHEQKMDQSAANVTDKAQKPEHD